MPMLCGLWTGAVFDPAGKRLQCSILPLFMDHIALNPGGPLKNRYIDPNYAGPGSKKKKVTDSVADAARGSRSAAQSVRRRKTAARRERAGNKFSARRVSQRCVISNFVVWSAFAHAASSWLAVDESLNHFFGIATNSMPIQLKTGPISLFNRMWQMKKRGNHIGSS